MLKAVGPRVRAPNRMRARWHGQWYNWPTDKEVRRWPTRFWMTLVGTDPAAPTQAEEAPAPIPRAQAGSTPGRADRHPVRAPNRDPLGVLAAGNGLRLRDDQLAPIAQLAGGRRVGADPAHAAGAVPRRRPDRLVARGGGQCFGAGAKRGPTPAPIP